jgi:transcription elongation factor Elf1
LQPYTTSSKKALPKPEHCRKCGNKTVNRHTDINDVHIKYIECKKCKFSSKGLPGRTWREAIEGWNNIMKYIDEMK